MPEMTDLDRDLYHAEAALSALPDKEQEKLFGRWLVKRGGKSMTEALKTIQGVMEEVTRG